MKCDICSNEASEQFTIVKHTYNICAWCGFRVYTFMNGNTNHSIINISWGAGKVGWSDWFAIRDFLRKHNITEVLEFGTGLSSELFVNEGIKLVSLDVLDYHSKLFSELESLIPYAKFISYTYQQVPKLDRQWEFVFVDGGQERSHEVRRAMEVSSKYIMLHDPKLGEQDFFPDENWIEIEPKIYQRKDTV